MNAKELAKHLHLSPAAVSIALNGKPGVSAKTRAIVLAAAAEYGILSKETNRATKTVCYMIFVDEYAADVAKNSTFSTFVFGGIDACAATLGYKTLIRYCYADSTLLKQMHDVLQHVDGIILLGTNLSEQHIDKMYTFLDAVQNLPIVVVDSFLLADRLDCVGNDCFEGGKLVAQYLQNAHHPSVGYFRFHRRFPNFVDRENGLRKGLQASNIPLAPMVEVDISSEGAFRDINDWLSTNPPLPSAFFAENDIVAAAALRAFKKHNIDVPHDISLVGFDDISICKLVDPPLTTVHSYKEQLGRHAMLLLHDRLTADTPNEGLARISISMKLVTRNSSKTCP